MYTLSIDILLENKTAYLTDYTTIWWVSLIILDSVSVCMVFSARCNIYISRLRYDVSVRLSVRLSVTEVRIIANLGFKFRSQFTAQWARGKGSSPGRVEGSSRAMLATARPSCLCDWQRRRVGRCRCRHQGSSAAARQGPTSAPNSWPSLRKSSTTAATWRALAALRSPQRSSSPNHRSLLSSSSCSFIIQCNIRLLGPFHGAIAVPSVTCCRCRCRRCRGHRCAGGARQYR